MKASAVIIPILLLFVFTSNAQNKWEVKGGVQLSYTSLEGEKFNGDFLAPYFGITNNFPLGKSKVVYMFTGLEYMQAGWKNSPDDLRKIHYVGLPLGWRFVAGRVHFLVGLDCNMRVSEKYVINGQNVLFEENKAETFDMPFQFGAAFDLEFAYLEFKYHVAHMAYAEDFKNRFFQLGLAFPLAKYDE